MKIIFNRNELSAAVAPLMCAACSKSSIVATEGILIEAKFPDICKMTTYDLQKGVNITVEAKVIEEGSFVINAQKFVQTIRVMEGEEITLTVDSKLSASILSGRSSHKMIALAGEDFPAIPNFDSDFSFTVSQSVLKRMICKVDFAMGINDQRAVLNGTFFKISDDSVMLVSCDSFKLAKCVEKTELTNKKSNSAAISEFSFIVPSKTVSELVKLLDDDEDALTQIFVTKKHIVMLIGEITFFSRLIEGDYIDYDRIIVKNHRNHLTVEKKELLNALERAALVTEEKIAGSVRSHVKLDIVDNIMKVSAVSAAGSTYDEVSIEHDGDEILIAFNNRYLMDCIKACEGEKIRLEMSTPLASMNIKPYIEADKDGNISDQKDEIYMLLPVRMKD